MINTTGDPEIEARLRALRILLTRLDQRYPPRPPFDDQEWDRIAGPPVPEELTEMEELMRLRDAEREASLAREAGLLP